MRSMAYSSCNALCTLLLLLLGLAVSSVQATYWTVTSVRVGSASVSTSGTRTTTRLYGATMVVRPTAAASPLSSATPLSTSRYANTYYDVTTVYLYYDQQAFQPDDIITNTRTLSSTRATGSDGTSSTTYYVQATVWRAPASCPTQYVVTTSTTISIPDQFTDDYTPTSWHSSRNTYRAYFTAYLSQDAITLPLASSVSAKLSQCLNPTLAFSRQSGVSSPSGPQIHCNNMSCTSFRDAVIVICSIIGALFLLGWIESFLWFRRLMMGRFALRVGTISWCMLTLICICLTKKEPPRTPEHQTILTQQWKAMPFGQKLRLWLRWGFSHDYPIDLLGLPNRALSVGERMKDGVRTQATEVQEPFIAPPPPYLGVNQQQQQQQQQQNAGIVNPYPAPPAYHHQGGAV
jgi:hypothetical protein